MSDSDRIEDVVDRIVKRQLSAAVVKGIDVKPDLDSDGDPVLRITVVIETAGNELDGAKILGLVRHLKSELAKSKHEVFPLLSFISKTEAAKLGLESV